MTKESVLLSHTLLAQHWERIGIRHHHGICLPLSALRSEQNSGIGDFGDLPLLIDWCKEAGFDCIQLLPLNDTGDDASPYNALSSCAIDPVYLCLRQLPEAGECSQAFEAFRSQEKLQTFAIKQQKKAWLRSYFERVFPSIQHSSTYLQFLEAHPWLHTYALFKVCKEQEQQRDWREWPIKQQSPSTCRADSKKLDFYCFLQYLAFEQLTNAKRYAETKGVLLKGDIPILLSPDSADVWAHRHLFSLEECAGAPPDMYNQKGQRWGFPLFNWDAMRSTQFAWWKTRLSVAESFYHLYRIDHVVGFFRIWAIRGNDPATKGRFIPPDPDKWERQGQELLEMMIRSSNMFPLAEDLGTIPPVVYTTLKHFGMPGTKVMRWQRRWDQDQGFIDPRDYEPISLTTVSTPDSETLQLWWRTRPEEAKIWAAFKRWTYAPELSFAQRKSILTDAHHTASLFHINLLQEYLALFSELVGKEEDERINLPGTVLERNWAYRFKPTLEQLFQESRLIEEVKSLSL